MKFPQDTDNKRRYSGTAQDIGDEHGDEYNKDITMSPISRLMDDSDEQDRPDEPGTFVDGYDRRPTKAEIPPAGEVERSPYAPDRSERERPPMRERPAPPSPSLSSDEDFFEVGIREARRERDRRRPTNPNPRPAVRATIPTPRRMSAPPPIRPTTSNNEVDPNNPDDVYDTFRQRYNPEDLISATKSGRAAKRDYGDTRGPASRAQAEEDERIDPTRVAVVGGAAAFLVILIILVVAMNHFRTGRNFYQAQAEENAGYRSRYNVLRTENTALSEANSELRTERNDLQALLAAQDTGQDAYHGNNNNDASDTETPLDQQDWPRQHTVARGQSLTVIARLHYGAERVNRHPFTYTEHIRLYNNMPNENTFEGRVINIPAPPAQ